MPDKAESLEQAAREFWNQYIQTHIDGVYGANEYAARFAAAFAEKKAAERERQVWAEAANIAEEPYSDEIQALGPDEPSMVGEKIAKALRARGEQAK